MMVFVYWFSHPPDKQQWTNCMGGLAKIKLSCCLQSNVFGNGFWKNVALEMEACVGPNWPSKATSKASVVKYANEEWSLSFAYSPPIEISVLGPSVRGKQGEPHRLMLPLTWSADLFSSYISLASYVLFICLPVGYNHFPPFLASGLPPVLICCDVRYELNHSSSIPWTCPSRNLELAALDSNVFPSIGVWSFSIITFCFPQATRLPSFRRPLFSRQTHHNGHSPWGNALNQAEKSRIESAQWTAPKPCFSRRTSGCQQVWGCSLFFETRDCSFHRSGILSLWFLRFFRSRSNYPMLASQWFETRSMSISSKQVTNTDQTQGALWMVAG